MVEKEELQELKVADLRALLQSDGLKVSGKKSELINRILANSGPASGGRATRSRSKSRSRSKPRSRSKSQARSKSRTRKAAAPEAKKKTSNPKKKSGAGSSKSKSLGFNPLLVPVLAIAAAAGNSVYLALTSPPPADFGSGSMFDKIAGRYDLINRALALNMDRAWRREMVAAVSSDGDLFAGGGKGVRVLDLATGTADVAILIAETANGEDGTTGASVLGVDPSVCSAKYARCLILCCCRSTTLPQRTLRLGHARLSFENQSYRYGIHACQRMRRRIIAQKSRWMRRVAPSQHRNPKRAEATHTPPGPGRLCPAWFRRPGRLLGSHEGPRRRPIEPI